MRTGARSRSLALRPLAPLLLAVLALPALPALPASAARIVDVRVGGHADFDRLVIQLDGEFRVFHQPARSGEPFVLELGAVPKQPILVLDTRLPRMGRVRIEGVSDGALVSVQPRQRRVRAFTLAEPPRVVIDFSSAEADPLPIPEGAGVVVEAIAPPWAPEPAPEPGTSATAPATPEPPGLEPGPEIVAGVEPTEPAEPVAPEAVTEVAPESPSEAAPEIAPEPALPDTARAEPGAEPTPGVGPALPEPLPEPPSGSARQVWIAALAGGVALVAIGLVLVLRARRGPEPAAPAPAAVPADTITPDELDRGAEDRLVALESRLDEEVRSRSRVEERLLSLHEDLKVVRDRLHRMSRQRGEDE